MENIIKNHCTKAAFQKGKKLEENNEIISWDWDKDEQNNVLYLYGKVAGNERAFYDPSLELDESHGYEIMSSRCQCKAYGSIPGLCKHLVAISLAYLKQETGNHRKKEYISNVQEFIEDANKVIRKRNQTEPSSEERLRQALGLGVIKKGIEPARPKTNNAITRIIEHLTQEVSTDNWQKRYSYEKVELEPILSFPYGSRIPEVTFRIGKKKKYVIKSLEQFIDAVEKRQYFEYGKNLGFVHTKEQFEVKSLPMLDFIMEYMYMKNHDRRRSFYYAPATKNIILDEFTMEKFFLVLENQADEQTNFDNSIKIQGTNHIQYTLYRRNPDAKIEIEKVKEGAYLRIPDFQIYLGTSEIFLINGTQIYHCSKSYAEDLWIPLEQFADTEEKELFIDNKDLQNVCAYLMPLLGKYFPIVEKNISLEEYEPPEVEFFIYLDDDKEFGVTCRLECQYGTEKYRIFQDTPTTVYRDRVKENQVVQVITKFFQMARRKSSDFMLIEEENLYNLLSEGIEELNQYGMVYASEAFRKNSIRQTPSVDFGVSIKSNLLDISIQADQLPYKELDEILNSYKMRKRYHRLQNGQFMELEDTSLSMLSELADGLEMKGEDFQKGRIQMPKHRALYIDAILKDAGEQVHVHRDNLFKRLIRNIKNVEDSDYQIPKPQQGILRSYQRKGYRWLRTIREYGFGGILADDMGLGKTLQVITLFEALKEEEKPKDILGLVICPASLVYNWENEIHKFAPNLVTQVILGTAKERKNMIQESKNGDIWITSYDLLKRDIEWYQNRNFDIQIIDEAQYIKNASTKVAKAVKNISSNTRFALTGTPIENRLSELWSIFDYLMPGLLFTYKRFKEDLESHIVAGINREESQESKETKRLKNMVRPFILRRLKEDVLKDLPKKLENVIYAKMEGKQSKLYNAHIQRLRETLQGQTNQEYNQNKIQILAELTRLRQICCDPELCYENYDGGSAKLSVCMELLEEVISSNHKVLVFSQFTTMLEKLAKELEFRHVSYYKLTGQTKKEQRLEMAQAFNQNTVPVFLISLKAGGTGLNLTGADMVIHYDPWWNQAAQNQATDRAHRIGQKNVVTVFKMITAESIEEKILALQEKKKNLADQIISDQGMSEISLSREDLLEILGDV
ncbi:MAG: DEAD/DEAH box helicase family protein [Lachnospiraceae bacterium]|nr:DEAD/DEAH box helicase family protein [Lachnospiraceae bacterium]